MREGYGRDSGSQDEERIHTFEGAKWLNHIVAYIALLPNLWKSKIVYKKDKEKRRENKK